MPLTVAIDATPLLGRPTGIGKYVGHLLNELVKDPSLDLRAYAMTGRSPRALGDVLAPGIRRPQWPLPAAVATRVWQHIDHPRVSLWTGAVDVVHGTNFVAAPGAPRVVTVHDMTSVRYPELCTPATLRYPALVQRAIDKGAIVQTPSQAVADEVVDHFGVAAERVMAVHHGVPEIHAGLGVIVPVGRFLLATGTIEPRKDYPTLLRAFDELADADPELSLIIAGDHGWGSDAVDAVIASMRHSAQVKVLGYVDEGTRGALLRNCAAFVYPSLYEGFGLPPLEAMSVGVPVVCTETTVAKEILGDAALTVPVGDSGALAGALKSVLDDETLRNELIQRGSDRCADYSWATCATAMKNLYRRAAAS